MLPASALRYEHDIILIVAVMVIATFNYFHGLHGKFPSVSLGAKRVLHVDVLLVLFTVPLLFVSKRYAFVSEGPFAYGRAVLVGAFVGGMGSFCGSLGASRGMKDALDRVRGLAEKP